VTRYRFTIDFELHGAEAVESTAWAILRDAVVQVEEPAEDLGDVTTSAVTSTLEVLP